MAQNQLKEELILSTHHFDKKIDDVIKQVNRLNKQGGKAGDGFNSSMGKMLQKATSFNGSMSNLLGTVTKLGGALGVITSGVQLADWFKNAVTEGTKLAQESEGVRLAFARLNRGDLLDKLREETHNTVTDVELMKQAVKFNDFKLNIDEMGTLLAFAQQKAKDTGQSIDYMVDSIVTGLGRKSLPILDNLGLSAAEIKERMKDSGDMTKAVSEIIKEKMQEAGGYVETAADRAKQKEVELQNELEELGRTFLPLQETSSNLWHSIEIGAIKAINSIRPLINEVTELGRVMNDFNKLGGNDKVNRMLEKLGDGKTQGQKNLYNNQLKEFDRYINERKQYLKDYHEWEKKKSVAAYDRMVAFQKKTGLKMFSDVKEQMLAAEKLRDSYKQGANSIFNSSSSSNSPTSQTTPTKTPKVSKSETIEYAVNSVGYLEKKISELQQKIKLQVDHQEIKKLQDEIGKTQGQLAELMQPTMKLDLSQLKDVKPNFASAVIDAQKELQEFLKREPLEINFKADKATLTDVADLIDNISYSFASLGDSFNEPSLDVAATIAQAIANIIIGYSQATTQAAKLGPFAWAAFTLGGFAQIASVVSQIHNLSGYANGGVVGGSSYGGDRLLARVNSGEAIVTQNQQKHLFELLNNGNVSNGASGGNVHFVIRGSELHGVLANYNNRNSKLR